MKRLILALLICSASISACKKDENPDIKIDSTKLSLKIGDRHQFVISKGDYRYKVESFSWSSSDISIGNVNGSGQIQATKEGVVTVSATYDTDKSIVLKCVVTVTK